MTPWEPLEHRRLMAAGTPIDLEGVQNASLDQPRINAYLSRTPGGEPLVVENELGDSFNIQAFFDTGASGVVLSKETADGLGVVASTHNGEEVLYEDVGVGGSEFFNVSEPLYVSLAPFGNSADIDNYATYEDVYTQTFGPVRTQVIMHEAEIFPLDVFGMPLFAGKTVVMDARPTNAEDIFDFGYMRTHVYDPGTPYNPANDEEDPGIVPTDLHVDLSYAHFGRFTSVYPEAAPGPTLRYNPFIGPNPIAELDPSVPADDAPGITIGHFGRTAEGSFLLDTGASASMISQEMATGVGVYYSQDVEHEYGSADPRLVDAAGNFIPDQFALTIGGIGGNTTVAGFWLDSLALPTIEGQPLRYLRAPVLVADISVAEPDPNPNDGIDPPSITLDGIFGMNFLAGSAYVDNTSQFPENVTSGAYDWIVFDEPNGILGLTLRDELGVTPAAAVVDRHVFYNRSSFDGNNAAATAADDLAVASDKDPLLPGGTATVRNFTSYSRGVNGVMVDVSNLPAGRTLSADDFVVRTGTTADPSGWAAGPPPASVSVRPGAGAAGSDRVTLTFPDGVIKNRWVQVKVLANADTGLAQPDVFYFGNLVGDTNDLPRGGLSVVSAADYARARREIGRTATVTNLFDFNRDGGVSPQDLGLLRGNLFQTLRLITAPAGASGAAASSDAVFFATRPGDEDSDSATASVLSGS